MKVKKEQDRTDTSKSSKSEGAEEEDEKIDNSTNKAGSTKRSLTGNTQKGFGVKPLYAIEEIDGES